MAVSTGNVTANTATGAHGSQSFSFNNDLNDLLVFVFLRDTNTAFVSALTYNGVALSKQNAASISNEYGSGLFHVIETWYLSGAAAGSNTLAATYSENVQSSAVVAIAIGGEHASSPIGNGSTNSGSGATPNVTFNTSTNNSLVIGAAIMRRASGGNYTAGVDSTELIEGETGTAAQSDITFTVLKELKATAGSMTIDTTNATSSAQWSMVAIEIKEAATANEFEQAVSGAISPAGTPIKRTNIPQLGSLTTAGAVLKQTNKPLIGATSFSGVADLLVAKVLGGVASFVGTLLGQSITGDALLTVSTGNDDGQETDAGTVTLTTSALDCDSTGDHIGFIIRDLPVPAEANITNAYINVYPHDSGRQSPNVTIKGELDPANFAASANNMSSRTKIGNIQWVASNIGINAYKSSPSITAIIQDIVDDPDYQQGDDVGIYLIQNSNSGWLRISSYNRNPSEAPQLYVQWITTEGEVFEQLLSGVASFVGTATKQTQTAKAGAIAFVGTLANLPQKAIQGAISAAGTVAKSISRALGGEVSPAGIVDTVKLALIVLAGALSAGGNIAKSTVKSFTGIANFTGLMATSKAALIALAGMLGFSGDATKSTAKSFVGSLDLAGAIESLKAAFLSLAGSLGLTGDATKQTQAAKGASLDIGGNVLKSTLKAFAGSLSLQGTLGASSAFIANLSGSLSAAGTLLRTPYKRLVGAIMPSGTIARRVQIALIGAIDFTGNVARRFYIVLVAALNVAGDLSKSTGKAIQGGVAIAGNIARLTALNVAGSIAYVGTLTKRTYRTIQGGISFIGSIIAESGVFIGMVHLTAKARSIALLAKERVINFTVRSKN